MGKKWKRLLVQARKDKAAAVKSAGDIGTKQVAKAAVEEVAVNKAAPVVAAKKIATPIKTKAAKPVTKAKPKRKSTST